MIKYFKYSGASVSSKDTEDYANFAFNEGDYGTALYFYKKMNVYDIKYLSNIKACCKKLGDNMEPYREMKERCISNINYDIYEKMKEIKRSFKWLPVITALYTIFLLLVSTFAFSFGGVAVYVEMILENPDKNFMEILYSKGILYSLFFDIWIIFRNTSSSQNHRSDFKKNNSQVDLRIIFDKIFSFFIFNPIFCIILTSSMFMT